MSLTTLSSQIKADENAKGARTNEVQKDVSLVEVIYFK